MCALLEPYTPHRFSISLFKVGRAGSTSVWFGYYAASTARPPAAVQTLQSCPPRLPLGRDAAAVCPPRRSLSFIHHSSFLTALDPLASSLGLKALAHGTGTLRRLVLWLVNRFRMPGN